MAELYSSSLLNDANLQGYWRMESNWNDSSPNGYTLTANNTPTFVAGKFGNAASFVAASSQYSTRAQASIANLRIAGSQTWICWVNQTTLTDYQYTMGSTNGDGSSFRGLQTSADAPNIVYFTLPGLTTNTQVNSSLVGLTTGTWFQIAGVYDSAAGKLRVYVNGALANEIAATGSVTDISSGGFAIGGRADGAATTFVNGLVDDAAVFNRALTTAEILSLFQAGAYLKTGKLWGA